MQWGSIGWAVPATFGYAVGASSRRTIALIGDGSFQLTAQEVAQKIRRKLPVIIFLINNHGYTIEVEIHDGDADGFLEGAAEIRLADASNCRKLAERDLL